MTTANKAPVVGRVMHVEVRDEAGRWTTYCVQVGPGSKISCWTPTAPGGSMTVPELYDACVQREAARREAAS